MFVENRAIDKDRRDFANAEASRRNEENQQFSNIGTNITDNVQKLLDHSDKEFMKNMERSNRMLSGIVDTIKTETGGDSFAFITFTPQESARAFTVSVYNHGDYALREVNVTLMDPDRSRKAMAEALKTPHDKDKWMWAFNAGDTHFHIPYLLPHDVQTLGTYPFSENETQGFMVVFAAFNGRWIEYFRVRRINGKWVEAIRVIGPTEKQSKKPFEQFDKEYPRNDPNTFDWVR